jgi:hypothetical protein
VSQSLDRIHRGYLRIHHHCDHVGPMSYVVAVDIGGTFTDLVAFDRERGTSVHLHQEPDDLRGVSSRASSSASPRPKLAPREASLGQSRHDPGHQRPDPAPRRHATALNHQRRLSRRSSRSRAATAPTRSTSIISVTSRWSPRELQVRSAGSAWPATGRAIVPLDIEQRRLAALARRLADLRASMAVAIFFRELLRQ